MVVVSEIETLTLVDALREFREQRGLSKRALSVQAGLSASYVGKLEAESIDPSMRAFAAIALALELTLTEIFFCVRCSLAEVRMATGAGADLGS